MDLPNAPQQLELGDIFREYGPGYQAEHNLPADHLKAMQAIEACRTNALGGHIKECDECGAEVPAYNSCRNRHCPKCGWLPQQKWLAARKKEILSVGYFHVVLTVPALLNQLSSYNQKVMYDILFKAGSETLLQLGNDPQHLGAKIGILAILHTWGQNLVDHPHLHCIVPCGGLSEDEVEWIDPVKSKKHKKFFVHVNVISDLFKKKFMHYLVAAYEGDELKLEGGISHLRDANEFRDLRQELYRKTWITYCKRPFGGAESVLQYLSRYTHRVAISNHRLIKIEDGRVYFKWKNYRKGARWEVMSLEISEFIRRFLLHVLPKGYFRIRHYGLLASGNRKKLWMCQELLKCKPTEETGSDSEKTWEEWLRELTGIDPDLCPRCKKGRLVLREVASMPPT